MASFVLQSISAINNYRQAFKHLPDKNMGIWEKLRFGNLVFYSKSFFFSLEHWWHFSSNCFIRRHCCRRWLRYCYALHSIKLVFSAACFWFDWLLFDWNLTWKCWYPDPIYKFSKPYGKRSSTKNRWRCQTNFTRWPNYWVRFCIFEHYFIILVQYTILKQWELA